MSNLEFKGNIENISPKALLDNSKEDKLQSFFLILGMIFNDLKGQIFLRKFVEENYRKPAIDEVSVQMGEYSGIMTQSDKYIIGIVSEFLIFLQQNRDVCSSIPFLLIMKKIDQKNRSHWATLIDPEKNGGPVISKIARVRSNIVFHYDHSSNELRKGFIRSFYSETKELPQHKKAYFSVGDDMENTRFYYSDAAAQEYINSIMQGEDMKAVREVVDSMNVTIQQLLKAYLISLKS